jgi:ubiquinone/menaquinone biosynthesis C-methylase UbiE
MLTVNFDIFQIRSGELVLDAGCGTGRHTLELSKQGAYQVYALDTDQECLLKTQYMVKYMSLKKEARCAVRLIKADTQHLPFRDKTFHKVICSEVLEHLPDDSRGLEELVRVLKNRGEMVITVPTWFTEWIYGTLSKEYFNCPGGHVRKYGFQKLAKKLKQNQLEIYAIGFAHAFHSIYWLLRCIFGLSNEMAWFPLWYHKFLVLSIRSRFVKRLEGFFNHFFPKSIIFYTRRVY